jgi:hypothetical protein
LAAFLFVGVIVPAQKLTSLHKKPPQNPTSCAKPEKMKDERWKDGKMVSSYTAVYLLTTPLQLQLPSKVSCMRLPPFFGYVVSNSLALLTTPAVLLSLTILLLSSESLQD